MTAANRPTPRRRWRTWLASILLIAAALTLAAVRHLNDNGEAITTPPASTEDPAAQLARGAYLAQVGNCAGCHTARGGAPYAGGHAIATPFGTVYAGNLTPDADTGLGRWSADDFWRALHHGRSRDGRLLNPAFPYTEFTLVRRDDADALFAFLRSLPPVAQPNRAHTLRFPFDTQAALAVWRALYFKPARFSPDATRSDEWNRGAYLVRGLGHCAACHAPRNRLGASRDALDLAGGAMPMQSWYAPALGPAAQGESGQQPVIDLLKTGRSAQGTASGPMAEVVLNSTQHWTLPDLQAAATYLRSLPRQPIPPVHAEPAPAGQMARGERLYIDHCAECHGSRGEGAPGAYPALAGNPAVDLATPVNLILSVLHGGFAPATAANPQPYGMPPQALSDAEVAAVLTFIRRSWGHQGDVVSELDVLRLR